MNEKTIEKFVKEAYDALENAITLSEEIGKEFEFYPAYGMGGTYYPKSYQEKYNWPEEGPGWRSSTASCN